MLGISVESLQSSFLAEEDNENNRRLHNQLMKGVSSREAKIEQLNAIKAKTGIGPTPSLSRKNTNKASCRV